MDVVSGARWSADRLTAMKISRAPMTMNQSVALTEVRAESKAHSPAHAGTPNGPGNRW